ncbi:kinase-like protein [Pluteus cervinus]|uniref:Kinase-like protein n=1 Tax=Pluteus cervinus TaxID=181527 RepID=A0ACD3AH94_9AGAR|nr:kinase-like protein [Pluteus cervinus]
MENTEQQQTEIDALKAIYGDDFLDCPPPKAWKVCELCCWLSEGDGAARLHEFIIKVAHPDPEFASKVYINLHVKFPKTYPALAVPILTIQKPAQGLTNDQVTSLSHAIIAQAQQHRGSESVFLVSTFCQEWIVDNVKPVMETPGSLAVQMNKRADDEAKERQRKAEEEARREAELAERRARELEDQIREDALRQQLLREQQSKSRKRANSEATEVPPTSDALTETFPQEVELDGVRFNTVRIFHPRAETLGTIYLADPVCDGNAPHPLELYVVTFRSQYYSTTQGRKKLKQVEVEIQKLTRIRHPNLVHVYAVKLDVPSSGPPQLMVLYEQPPALSLHHILEDCDYLREDRATEYFMQVLAALNAVHAGELMHRGITPRCIGLVSRDPTEAPQTKTIKMGRVCFYTKLYDLHRSEPFGAGLFPMPECPPVPEGWLSKDAKNESSLVYTRQRDIHAAGITFMQMMLGLNVTERIPDVHDAILSLPSAFLQHFATSMLHPAKKQQISCLTLLTELSSHSLSQTTNANDRTPPIPFQVPRTPMGSMMLSSSPEISYFQKPIRSASRWKEDWEELELLGKGAYGSVVKARNKIDQVVYAVKKISLRATQSQSNTKIFREVNALSRLSHRNIVRYYTTWFEISEPSSTAASDDSDTEGFDETGMTSVPDTSERHLPNNSRISFDLDDLEMDTDRSSSFPSIHFTRSTDDDSGSGSGSSGRTLYIQMEFVERQTLRERVDEGVGEDEAWRLFQQIVEALAHMSTLGILHRDIKPNNIFIGELFVLQFHLGNCKVGDFGLATTSLAAVESDDTSLRAIAPEAEMTLEVGTRLYIAPEVQSRKRVPRNHSKADLYSLGIVFFEMNYHFTTTSERIAVLEELRKPGIFFPANWPETRSKQREIITQLLQHDPDLRPNALDLLQSPLLPQRLEDEYFKNALRMIAKPDSPHHQAVLNALFGQTPKASRGFLYDPDKDSREYAKLHDVVTERLAAIFRLHGAVNMEPPLLMHVTETEDTKNHTAFIDTHGDITTLPNNILMPFAKLAAKEGLKRIKRYHISNVYRPNPLPGAPKAQKAAVFDIITPDLESGPIAAGAEIISVINDCLESFPNLSQTYDIHVSHSALVELVLNKIPAANRTSVVELLNQYRSNHAQRRTHLLKKGISRAMADEFDVLLEIEPDVGTVLSKLEKLSSNLAVVLQPIADEIKTTIQFAQSAGVFRQILFHPLMLGNHHAHFKGGILVEVVKKGKRMEVLAAAGRYDSLITKCSPPKTKVDGVCAIGLQVSVEKITMGLAAYQSLTLTNFLKEERSFGYWSPRRCDVYVVSYHAGGLQERLEVVSYLWKNNISADLMYESGLPDSESENYLQSCAKEGILFTVYPRLRAARRDQAAFKVKSILKGTEYELSRQELVGWLQERIAEQKKTDLATSGVSLLTDHAANVLSMKEHATSSDVQLILPVDIKKQRKHVKHIFGDRAYATAVEMKQAMSQGMPFIAVDVPPNVFEMMTRSSTWITDDEVWKGIVSAFPPGSGPYAQQIREAVAKWKAEKKNWVILNAVREDRVQILSLNEAGR